MKFLSYNIRYSLGQDGRYDLSRTVKAMAGADVIALQEVERFWHRTGNVDQVAEIAQRLPAYYWAYVPGLDVDASVSGVDRRVLNRRRQFGNLLLSKFPIQSSQTLSLPKLAFGDSFNMTVAAMSHSSWQKSPSQDTRSPRFCGGSTGCGRAPCRHDRPRSRSTQTAPHKRYVG